MTRRDICQRARSSVETTDGEDGEDAGAQGRRDAVGAALDAPSMTVEANSAFHLIG
jgi:hypothetical protein